MPASKSNVLLVEGLTDLVVIAELAEAHGISWHKGEEPVDIVPLGTKTPAKKLEKPKVTSRLLQTGLKNLGVVLDADDASYKSWELVRVWFVDEFQDLPNELPEAGYISEANPRGQRLGVWIMLDNRSTGTLETLLKKLVRPASNAVLEHAVKACEQAKQLGAPFKAVHAEKAHVFTWLAWQDEPGRNLKHMDFGDVFDPRSRHAQPFITWFQKLFEI